MLKAIEALSEPLGMTVIAEGVETFEEAAYLQAATRIQIRAGILLLEAGADGGPGRLMSGAGDSRSFACAAGARSARGRGINAALAKSFRVQRLTF